MLERALPPALVQLLLTVAVSAAPPTSYNFLDNYRDPAPAAEDGPPASYNAVRDKNVLPYEICGVVGGYVLTVLIWGVLLLTVGRRMRRKALDPPKQLELELQDKPTRPMIRTPGLASPPLSARSWLRKFRTLVSAVVRRVPSSHRRPPLTRRFSMIIGTRHKLIWSACMRRSCNTMNKNITPRSASTKQNQSRQDQPSGDGHQPSASRGRRKTTTARYHQ
jgi:hypothetical protein